MTDSPVTATPDIRYLAGPASEDDVEPFCQLILLAQTDTDAGVRSPDKVRACLRALLPFDARYVAAYDEDKLVGVVIGCHYNRLSPDSDLPGRTYLASDLAIHPDYRRRGIATQLLCALTRSVAGSYDSLFGWVFPQSRNFHLHAKLEWRPGREAGGKIGVLKRL